MRKDMEAFITLPNVHYEKYKHSSCISNIIFLGKGQPYKQALDWTPEIHQATLRGLPEGSSIEK